MADLSPTAAQVSPVNETQYTAKVFIAAAAITAGQLVYLNSSGKADLAKANATGTIQQLLGVAMKTVAAGKAVTVLFEGSVYGLGVAAFGSLYVSAATAGAISDAAITGTGNFNVCIGRVYPMTDDSLTKVAYIHVPQNAVFTALP